MSTASDSFGLVTTIMPSAPIRISALRSAWRDYRARRRLDLRGVGGQPRHHLAGMRHLVEGGAQAGEMLEHVAADVGDHPLAEPVDAVEARGAGQGEDQADADQRDEIFVDEARDRCRRSRDRSCACTASGTASVAAAETMSASRAAAEHAPMAQEIGPQARAAGATRRACLPRASAASGTDAARGGRRRQVLGLRVALSGPANFVRGPTLRSRGRATERADGRALPAQPCATVRTSVIGSAQEIRRISEGWSHEKGHSSRLSPHQSGDDRRHRVRRPIRPTGPKATR